jgi:hypothetical protein
MLIIKNELEMFLIMVEIALKEKINTSKSVGKIFNKDTYYESKMKWKDTLKCLSIIKDYFEIKGSNSIGICKTCKKWYTEAHSNKNFGTCKGGKGGDCCNAYNTCDQHTI